MESRERGPLSHPRRRPVTGRSADLRVLEAVLAAAVAGHGGAAIITGEPGIGKTWLMERLSEVAEDAGCRVAWARGWESDTARAYQPWLRALGSLLGPDLSRTLLQRTAPENVFAGPADARAAQARAHAAVADALREASEHRPVVLALDDLQWFDAESALLLAHLVPELVGTRILLLGAARDTEPAAGGPLTGLLDRLASGGAVLPLHGLDDDAVAEAVAGLTGDTLEPDAAAAVRAWTGGNPLFVREMVRMLMSESRLGALSSSTAAELPLPGSVRSVLERRLATLTSPARRVLAAVAVLGDGRPVPHLGEVADLAESEARAGLDEAAAARLLVDAELPRFTHDLVRAAVRQSTSAEVLRSLHRRAAAVAAGWHAGEGDGDDAVVALHLSAAGELAAAAPHWLAAARAALHRGAWHEAAARLNRARQECGDLSCELLLMLGDALGGCGDDQGARTAFLQAAALAREAGDADAFARAALGYGAGLSGFEVALFDLDQRRLLEEALTLLPVGDSALRSWLLGRLSVALSFSTDTPQRRELAESAVAMARRVGDPASLARALAAWCDSVAGADHVEDRLAASLEMEQAARSAGDPVHVLLALRFRVVALLEQGDVGRARREVRVFASKAAALHHPLVSWYVPLFRGTSAMISGRAEEALAAADEVVAAAGVTGSGNALVLGTSQKLGCFFLLDRWDDIRALADQVLSSPESYEPTPSLRPVLALVALIRGDTALALAELDRAADERFEALPKEDSEWLGSLSTYVELAVHLSHARAGALLHERLAPYRHRFVVDGIGAGFWGSVALWAGRAAAVAGRYEDARDLILQSQAEHRRLDAPLLLGRSEAALAELRDRQATPPGGRSAASQADPGVTLDSPLGESAVTGDFEREGDGWRLRYGGTTVTVRDVKGMHDLSVLLRRPGCEVHVGELTLARPADGAQPSRSQLAVELASDVTLGPLVDRRAAAAYRRRLAELESDIADAESRADLGHVAGLRWEKDALLEELRTAFGLGGRARTPPGVTERARKAVSARIRDAVRRIGRVHPELGRHLQASIRTGTFCCYQPERPTHWTV